MLTQSERTPPHSDIAGTSRRLRRPRRSRSASTAACTSRSERSGSAASTSRTTPPSPARSSSTQLCAWNASSQRPRSTSSATSSESGKCRRATAWARATRRRACTIGGQVARRGAPADGVGLPLVRGRKQQPREREPPGRLADVRRPRRGASLLPRPQRLAGVVDQRRPGPGRGPPTATGCRPAGPARATSAACSSARGHEACGRPGWMPERGRRCPGERRPRCRARRPRAATAPARHW